MNKAKSRGYSDYLKKEDLWAQRKIPLLRRFIVRCVRDGEKEDTRLLYIRKNEIYMVEHYNNDSYVIWGLKNRNMHLGVMKNKSTLLMHFVEVIPVWYKGDKTNILAWDSRAELFDVEKYEDLFDEVLHSEQDWVGPRRVPPFKDCHETPLTSTPPPLADEGYEQRSLFGKG